MQAFSTSFVGRMFCKTSLVKKTTYSPLDPICVFFYFCGEIDYVISYTATLTEPSLKSEPKAKFKMDLTNPILAREGLESVLVLTQT